MNIPQLDLLELSQLVQTTLIRILFGHSRSLDEHDKHERPIEASKV